MHPPDGKDCYAPFAGQAMAAGAGKAYLEYNRTESDRTGGLEACRALSGRHSSPSGSAAKEAEMTPKRNLPPEPPPGCPVDDLDEDCLPVELLEVTRRDGFESGPAAMMAAERVRRISTQPPPFLAYGYK